MPPPSQLEPAQIARWQHAGVAKPRGDDHAESFTVLLPPPNITGALHIGHALTIAIEDAMARFQRMDGKRVHWIPGTDHAGIATQVVVEKHIAREMGKTRHELGREGFLAHVWRWKARYGDERIRSQIDRLGASVDWDAGYFTLDAARSHAVTTAFERLAARGLVYRAARMVHWCPALRSVVSDVEAAHVDLSGPTVLQLPAGRAVQLGLVYDLEYELEAHTRDALPHAPARLKVATTRPETVLGDVALAVHPEDPRYRELLAAGAAVRHPLSGARLPLVADALLVDTALGSGCVKLTPGADFADHEAAQRLGLAVGPPLMNDDGTIAAGHGAFAGLDRFAAREAVLAALQARGLYGGTPRPHAMRIATCSRTGDVLEPRLMRQWFVSVRPLAAAVKAQLAAQSLRFSPPAAADELVAWLDSMRDWCLSRQLWWGHRVPAYRVYVGPPGARERCAELPWLVAASANEARARAVAQLGSHQAIEVVQDEDVLDTWFSSALLPLAALGWPAVHTAPALALRGYPLAVMETGSDILAFWVARMLLLCTALGPEPATPPFRRVLLHPLVRDAAGRKMSKSLGNAVDPLALIDGRSLPALLAELEAGNLPREERARAAAALRTAHPHGIAAIGADALRWGLASTLRQSSFIALDARHLSAQTRVCNKLWQAARFVAAQLARSDGDASAEGELEHWLAVQTNTAIVAARAAYTSGELHRATDAVGGLLIDTLCGVYLEHAKDAPGTATRQALARALARVLALAHPIMPFVTEALWNALPQLRPADDASRVLALSAFPQPDKSLAEPAALQRATQTARALDALAAARSAKAALGAGAAPSVALLLSDAPHALQPLARLAARQLRVRVVIAALADAEAQTAALVRAGCRVLGAAGGAGPARVVWLAAGAPAANAAPAAASGVAAEEAQRRRAKLARAADELRARLQSNAFRSRASPEAVREAQQRLADVEARLAALRV